MNGKNASRGFTLIELLVVLAILGVVSTVGFVIFGRMNGYWGDLRTRTALEREADNILDNMRQDFGAVVSTKLIAARLVGEEAASGVSVLSFPIESQTANGQKTASIVKYSLDSGLKRALADPLSPESQLSATVLGSGVTQFRVEYSGANGTWQSTWNEPVLPKSVRVSLAVVDTDNPEQEQVARKAVFNIHVD